MLAKEIIKNLEKQILDDHTEIVEKITRLRGAVLTDYEKGDEDEVDLERATTLGRIQELEQRLLSLDQTLQRMARGLYGLCQSCGAEIAAERLEIMPETTLCLACKAAGERSQKAKYLISDFE